MMLNGAHPNFRFDVIYPTGVHHKLNRYASATFLTCVQEEHVNVKPGTEWIANSTKQTGSRNFGFQLPRASQSLIG